MTDMQQQAAPSGALDEAGRTDELGEISVPLTSPAVIATLLESVHSELTRLRAAQPEFEAAA